MPSQRNQHYVPKVYMRPFGVDTQRLVSERRAIHLYNVERAIMFPSAAIKHQCASNYFYGSDGVLENLLSRLEGHYAETQRAIVDGRVTSSHLDWLRLFLAFQSYRTAAAIEKTKQFWEQSYLVTFKGKKVDGDQQHELTHEFLLNQSMRQAQRLAPFLDDLKFCVIRNESDASFVTSDSPVIFTNRWFIQQLGRTAFGGGSSGALFIMPINPRIAVCLYDQGIYSMKQHGGIAHVHKMADILALNELQYLSAHKNIYFTQEAEGERIAAEFEAIRSLRLEKHVIFSELAEDGKFEGVTRYRKSKDATDADSGDSKLINFQFVAPIPRRWPSVVGFRNKKVFYENGTAMGIVRKREWLEGVRPTY